MQIQQISVEGLFGTFNHVIPLNTKDRITIIHGPNGFGKTAILKMLHALFNGNGEVLLEIVFDRFQVELTDGTIISASTEFINIPNSFSRKNVVFKRHNKNSTKSFHSWKETGESPYIREGISSNVITGQEKPQWLLNLLSEMPIQFIEDQRLLQPSPDPELQKILQMQGAQKDISLTLYKQKHSGEFSVKQTVSNYSEEVKKIIQSKVAKYGEISQALDRTFPNRILNQKTSNLTVEQLVEQLKRLEKNRAELIEAGVLGKDESSNFDMPEDSISDSTKNILSLYVEDMTKKLDAFNEIASKIRLLRKMMNKKLEDSYKQVYFSHQNGFVFKNSIDNSHISLSPADLSSGEQHELVMLYELIFKTEPNSLVLIDEPELSLHVGWQVQFLEDLKGLADISQIDFLIATHAPSIIHDRWDLTVELQGLKK
jgi:predicted ATP-binding protein involved in virulence